MTHKTSEDYLNEYLQLPENNSWSTILQNMWSQAAGIQGVTAMIEKVLDDCGEEKAGTLRRDHALLQNYLTRLNEILNAALQYNEIKNRQ